jgi:hypothetical protein
MAMSDDWRLHLALDDRSLARELGEMLAKGELEHELDDGYSERVIASVDDREVFLYTGSREQAEHAAAAVGEHARRHGWRINQQRLERWHPVAELWEDPDTAVPRDAQELGAERAELIAEERAESEAEGYPGWEVRVECESHHDTIALSERLKAEGLQHVRRWRFLLLGATDEDSANELAQRLRAELPSGCTVAVEGTLHAIEAELPPNPFAVFGGLGG